MKDIILRLNQLASCSHQASTCTPSPKGAASSAINQRHQPREVSQGRGLIHQLSDVTRFASRRWHSDITFEPVPSDYASPKIHTLPTTGGDTLWASGYELYDRLSPPCAKVRFMWRKNDLSIWNNRSTLHYAT
ncbi:hypothetical protein B0H63DRAFT_545033 [Podospora didyma]|uniref:TauD/TfdA-like domain-containing protein n=1 Tax=Podospora didyma TaxID=330526 RepID=A0AAE0NG31_9PEZI|nr:hypothetical protein B0H63DRAFT_545033 [Podospora didyma]